MKNYSSSNNCILLFLSLNALKGLGKVRTWNMHFRPTRNMRKIYIILKLKKKYFKVVFKNVLHYTKTNIFLFKHVLICSFILIYTQPFFLKNHMTPTPRVRKKVSYTPPRPRKIVACRLPGFQTFMCSILTYGANAFMLNPYNIVNLSSNKKYCSLKLI